MPRAGRGRADTLRRYRRFIFYLGADVMREFTGEVDAPVVPIVWRLGERLVENRPEAGQLGFRRVPIFGGSAVRCWLMTTAGLKCWNEGAPVRAERPWPRTARTGRRVVDVFTLELFGCGVRRYQRSCSCR